MSDLKASQPDGRRARLLVTGAHGFIGRNLLARLTREGYECHVLVRTASHGEGARDSTHTEHICGDAGGSVELLSSVVRKVQPDVVVHLASYFVANHQPDQVDDLVASNILFGTRLLEALDQNGVKRLINTGTFWQHYQDADYDPVCLYAATKQAFQDIVQYFVTARHMQCITLLLSDTYGSGDQRPKLMALLQKTAESAEELGMSPGEQLIDLVHVDDVVEAYCLSIRHLLAMGAAAHEVFAVTSGSPVSLRSVVATFEGVLGRKLPIRFGARPYRPREVMRPWIHPGRVPEWTPRISLEEGLRTLLGAEAGGKA